MTIKSLSGESTEVLFEAFNSAFEDYERSWTRDEFDLMLRRRGYDARLSFGAFYEGKLVSFTLNGIGLYGGVKTAYDTATGTIKAFRGQKLSTLIFNTSLPYLADAAAQQYLLEVLDSNGPAISIYNSIGFDINRMLNYFIAERNVLPVASIQMAVGYVVKDIDLSYQSAMEDLQDYLPAWQNSFESIRRSVDGFRMIGVFDGEQLIGYGIIESNSGDIPQLAVDKAFRRKGIGTLLFQTLMQYNLSNHVRIINTDHSCGAVTAFLNALHIAPSGQQLEMQKQL